MEGSMRWIVLLHVLSAFWLTASAFGGTVVRAVGRRAPDFAGKIAAMRIGARLAMVFGMPGSIAAGLTGLLLVFRAPAYLQMGWVHVSITLWVVILATNLFYSLPRMKRLLAAAEASLAAGAPSDEFKRLASSKLPARVADLNALAVVIFVVLMVLKPF